jgi:hypothetical protein
VRKSKESIFSSHNIDTIVEDVLEFASEDMFIGNTRIESNSLSIFIAKLNSKKIVVVIGILSKNPIVGFSFRSVKVYCCWGDFDSVNNCHVVGYSCLSIYYLLFPGTPHFILPKQLEQCVKLKAVSFGFRTWELNLIE